MNRRYSFVLALVLLTGWLAASCASNKILIDPAAKNAKTIALIGVTAARLPENVAGKAILDLPGAGDALSDQDAAQLVKKVAGNAAATMEARLAEVPGWSVVSSDKVHAAPGYAEAAKLVHDLSAERRSRLDEFWSAPEGRMVTVDAGTYKGWTEVLGKAATLLNVDAVVVLDLQVGYRPNSITGISETGVAQVVVSATAVDRNEKYVFNTRSVDFSHYRAKSTATAPLKALKLVDAQASEEMFKQAFDMSLRTMLLDMKEDRKK